MTAHSKEEMRMQLKVNSFVLKNLSRFFKDGWRRIGKTEFLEDHYEVYMKHPSRQDVLVISYSVNMSEASVFIGDKLIQYYNPNNALH